MLIVSDIGRKAIFTIFTSGFCSAQPKIALPGKTYLRKYNPFSFSHYFHRIFCSCQTLLGPRKTQVRLEIIAEDHLIQTLKL